jgi:hypothetical protein
MGCGSGRACDFTTGYSMVETTKDGSGGCDRSSRVHLTLPVGYSMIDTLGEGAAGVSTPEAQRVLSGRDFV